MDPVGGCGTIAITVSVSRWLRHLSLVTLVALVWVIALGTPAHAQVFKPRGGKPAVAGKASTAAAVARKAAPAAASSKKPTRATGATPRRAAAPVKKARGKARAEPDAVVIEDEDDDVKITDD